MTGNPVYPAAFLIWPGARFPETSLAEYGRRYGIRRAVADAVDVYANWPRFHAVMAVAGLVGLAAWLVVEAGPPHALAGLLRLGRARHRLRDAAPVALDTLLGGQSR